MTNEQRRIAIAEKCGIYVCDFLNGTKPNSIPDYLNDLNAMHEAEKILKLNGNEECEWSQYQETLWYIVNPHIPFSDDQCFDVAYMKNFVNATAEQRAEAFYKTFGLE